MAPVASLHLIAGERQMACRDVGISNPITKNKNMQSANPGARDCANCAGVAAFFTSHAWTTSFYTRCAAFDIAGIHAEFTCNWIAATETASEAADHTGRRSNDISISFS
jgi:hypothetical protein